MNLFLSRRAKLGLVLFAAVSVALGVVLSARFGGPELRTSQPFRLMSTLVDAQGVRAGSDVLLRGVEVGRVGGVGRRGGQSRITLELGGSAPRLVHPDAIVRIGTKTPLGESFVDVDPGHARGRVRAGASIRSAPTVELDEALEALDPRARRDLTSVLGTSGRGLRSPAAGQRIGGTVDALSQTVSQLDAITRTLRGQAQDIAGTVQAGRTVLAALATRDSGIRALVADARRTLTAAASEPAALRGGLRELPALTREVGSTLRQADGLITDAGGPVRDLRRAAAPLTLALRTAPAPLDDLALVLDRAPSLRAAAAPTLGALDRALPALTPALHALGPALADVVPMLDYLAPRSPTIAAWFANTDALGQHGDAKGRWARFFIGIDPHTALGIPHGPPQNAYTQPGDALHNQPYRSGDFPQLQPYAPALAGSGPAAAVR